MQDAYFQEKGDVGGWLVIGYSAPGTGASTSYESGVFKYSPDGAGSADANGWTAQPTQKLNDCETTAFWKLLAEYETGKGSFQIKDNGTDTKCKRLTASWDNLTRSSN